MKKMKFIRFGGLSPVKQDHYTSGDDKCFHNPPRRKGIYAFPYPYIEKFLLGSTDTPGHISNKSKWLKDDNGNKILFDDFYDDYDRDTDKFLLKKESKKFIKKRKIKESQLSSKYSEDGKTYVIVYNKPKIFNYDGEIWHHLKSDAKPEQIINSNGSWIKTTMNDYLLLLKLDIKNNKKDMLKTVKGWGGNISEYLTKDPYNHFYTKDHLEVFIEKIK